MAAAPGARKPTSPPPRSTRWRWTISIPYRVYGAQQDNTTVIVPSLPLGNGQDFRVGPGCETGPIIPDKDNPDIVYGGCKGQFSRLNLNTTDEERYWIGARVALRQCRRRADLPLPARFSDGGFAIRAAHGLLRIAVSASLARWRRDLEENQSGSHRPSRGHAGRQRRADHARRHRRRGLQHAVRDPRIAAAEGPHLDRLQRRPGLRDARRRQDLDQRHAQRSAVRAGACRTSSPARIEPGTAYVAIYRFLLGDFAPYIYRTDDFGKTWTRLTDGKNGIAADEPTRVVREDPDRAGLLYAGTEFGMYISFDNGAQWQSFQLNLPETPVTDIKVAHKDLIFSTQGRSFWILDNLTPLHQLNDQVSTAPAFLFKPREAMRTIGRGGSGRGGGIQYPPAGATIDYYLSSAPAGDITLEILDSTGSLVRKFTSAAPATPERPTQIEEMPSEDEGGGFRMRGGPTRLDKSAGLHRFTWDLRYPGSWQSAERPEGPSGPSAVPGKYSVRLTVGSWTSTQPFTVIEDPRVTKDGVTTADLREQFDHNMRVRDLVSDVNKLAARIRAAQAKLRAGPDSEGTLSKVNELASHLITPPIRYSKPELQTHITYLYSVTSATDQKIGRDAIERYQVLRQELDKRIAEADQILGKP